MLGYKLRECNSGRKRVLEEGDVIVYDETARAVKFFSSKTCDGLRFVMGNNTYGDEKIPFPLSEFVALLKILSAVTGLVLERREDYPAYKHAFRFWIS